MRQYYRIVFCIVFSAIILSTTILSAPTTSDAIQYETQTISPFRVGGAVIGGTVTSQGLTTQTIAAEDCSAGTCDNTNSMNYGFDGSAPSNSRIKIVLTYDLAPLGINGSAIKDVAVKIGGCWHGGDGSLCNGSDDPEFASTGGRLHFSILNGVTWEAMGTAINLGSDGSSIADTYAPYQAVKSSGFSDSYLDNGKLRIGLLTGGVTAGEFDVQQVIDYALLDVKYLPVNVDTRPNIIVIYTDDQRWDTMQYMPTVQNRLIGEGIELANSFVTNPLCCPSRSSFFTGQYAHEHGIWTNHAPDGGATAFNDTSTLPIWLQDAGYTTGYFGKYLNDYKSIMSYVPPGWDDWHSHAPQYSYLYTMNDNGVLTKYNATESDYSTDVLRNKAIDFIRDTNEPFFLMYAPDTPHVSPTGYAIPAKRHVGTCENIEARPPSFYEEDVSDKPQWIKNLAPGNTNTTSNTDKISKGMVCSLKAIDEAIAAMMDELGPRLDNTLIVFTSDNGYSWGEHRWNFKTCAYEECIRVPLAMRYPPLIPAGQKSDALVLNLDVTATILDLANATAGLQQRGESLVPVFADPSTTEWRQDFLLEQARFPSKDMMLSPGFNGLRTTTDKYVKLETNELEYYDLINDPYELNNLAYDPAYADVIFQKQLRLEEILQETSN